MIKPFSNNILTIFKEFIDNFENKKFEEKKENQNSGIIYTPKKIADIISENIFKIYFIELIPLKFKDLFQKRFNFKKFHKFLSQNLKIKENICEKIKNIKILDPACGSGRFLISVANILFNIYKILYPEIEEYICKKNIIQNNIYGIEIDKSAYIISKLRLVKWLFSNNITKLKIDEYRINNLKLENFDELFNTIDIKFNIYNSDFLLEFESDYPFNIIIGNPPYIENKRIKDQEYKKKLYNNFESAYKLFDLSILFIEKSLELLKENEGYLSFLVPNKFLSADYGVKIRELLVNKTELKEIINISSLPIFNKTATYPIIISFKRGNLNNNNEVLIKKFNNLEDLIEINHSESIILPQNLIKELPANVIPISGNINLIRYIYTNYNSISATFSDLKIIYRPFGFTKWAKYFENISENKGSEKDLLLIGTGNVGKYHIKLNKRIKIAKKDLKISYFNYNPDFEDVWHDLSNEKIIFREIAKELTCIYDPGIFTNITGLYFIKLPSFDTDKLYCLLTILNSKLMDSVFKTLFSTLHMSGGYLRFNGSFIKKLPMTQKFPEFLSLLGKVIQFLSQLLYNINSGLKNEYRDFLNRITKYLNFFFQLANSLVYLLFLKDYFKKKDREFFLLQDLLESEYESPKIQFKNIYDLNKLPEFKFQQTKEINANLNEIDILYNVLVRDKDLLNEIEKIIGHIDILTS